MPLIFEIWDAENAVWKERGQIIPGDQPGSVSNFTVLGGREIIIFACDLEDDSSGIYKSAAGVDVGFQNLRAMESIPGQRKLLKELKDGDEFEMSALTDRALVPVRLKFRHQKIDFGKRHCLLCEQEVPANSFGAHIFGHPLEEIADWPGGQTELLKHLRRSINESIKRAKGFPRIQEQLKQSMKLINGLEKRLKARYN
jgi:hypothetical protein